MKIYQSPATETITLQTEGVVANSDKTLTVDDSKSGPDMLSSKKGWDSENWEDGETTDE